MSWHDFCPQWSKQLDELPLSDRSLVLDFAPKIESVRNIHTHIKFDHVLLTWIKFHVESHFTENNHITVLCGHIWCPPVSAGVAQPSSVLQDWPSMLSSCSQSIFFFSVLTGPPGAAAGCQILDYPAKQWAKGLFGAAPLPSCQGALCLLPFRDSGSPPHRAHMDARPLCDDAPPSHTFKLLINVSLCLWPSSGPRGSQWGLCLCTDTHTHKSVSSHAARHLHT